mmetsp:Transcript_56172/g.93614  ORF Transcript_56172/g.93614 Transcript_56172/m.93614 type:complete len:142 (-) Transcript_56172:28-453(-)
MSILTDENATIQFDALEITPNECEFSKELCISATFRSSHCMKGRWKFLYVVDSSFTKHVINLGDCSAHQIVNDNKPNSLEFKIDKIDVANIKDYTLFNTGLLKLQLTNEETHNEVITVNIVAQITKENNKLMRTFFNPLEG